MRYGSVCSGIEAATAAWHPLGWRASFVSEIEPFPRAVLKHRWPEIPLHGDFTTIQAGEYEPIDLLVGGTPCQSFSVAGLRGGLADDRGNLALEYLRLADRLRPRWLVWENVPGVLSSAGGRDFGAILGGMVELGYGFAYRVLDAQFFGVAQRRRRVFVVGHLGDWRRAAAVLFERHSLSGHPAPRRQAGEGVAGDVAHSLRAGGFDASEDGTGRGTPLVAGTLAANGKAAGSATQQDAESGMLIAFSAKDHGADAQHDLAPTLRAGGHCDSHPNAGVMPAIAFALRGREGGAMPEVNGDQVGALRAASGGSSRDYVSIGVDSRYASPQEADATSALLALREAVGAQAFEEWGQGVLDTLQPAQILRPGLHGGGVRREADEAGCGVDDGPLSRSAGGPTGALPAMRQAGRERRPPQGRGLSEQLTRKLGEALSELPHEGAPAEAFLRCLRRAGEGLGALQQALHSAQGRPTRAVRRLTPVECERLQGFPDNYTLIPWRNGMAPDGPRYKALGNSMAVPVMAWIGRRIEAVEAVISQAEAA